MIATLELMTRPKKPETETVRISAKAAKKARIVSAARGETLPEWLSRVVEAAADEEYFVPVSRLITALSFRRERNRKSGFGWNLRPVSPTGFEPVTFASGVGIFESGRSFANRWKSGHLARRVHGEGQTESDPITHNVKRKTVNANGMRV